MAEFFANAVYALQVGIFAITALTLIGAAIVAVCYIAGLLGIEFGEDHND